MTKLKIYEFSILDRHSSVYVHDTDDEKYTLHAIGIDSRQALKSLSLPRCMGGRAHIGDLIDREVSCRQIKIRGFKIKIEPLIRK